MTPSRSWLALIALVAVCTAGFELLEVPSAPLFGGLLGGLLQTLALRGTARLPPITFRLAQGIVGVTVGAMIDWGRLVELGSAWPAVIAVTAATLVVSVGVGQILRLHRGVSASTATFATIAGGASGMTAIANDFGADDRIVTVIQYFRVLVILSTLPLFVSWAFHTDATGAAVVAPAPDQVLGIVYTVLAVGVGLTLGTLLRIPSPAVLGGIAVGAALAALPVFEDAGVPAWLRAAAFVLIGVQVGLRFTRATLRRIGLMMPTAVVVIALIIALCAVLGLLLSEATGVSRIDGYLATTPGGLPAVLAATAATGGDITFVSTVQLLRILIVLVSTPFLARWIFGRPAPSG